VQNRQPDPLLARWQYGLGRVLVWTPGLENSWSASWRRAEPAFFTDALRWTLRGAPVASFAPALAGGPLPNAIRIDTLTNTGTAVELQRLTVDVQAPDGKVTHPAVVQTGSGVYEAPYHFATPGIYTVTVRQLGGSGSLTTSLLAVPYSQEYTPAAPNAALLATLASGTGGTSLHSVDQLPTIRSSSGSPLALWWAFALAALVAFLAAVAAGRLIGEADSNAGSNR
jgi:hypothetical protein